MRGVVAAQLFALVACSAPARTSTPPPSTPATDADDRDGDRIVDDRCPDAPETYNGYEDDDGCPDRAPADRKHCVWNDYIYIPDKIWFAPDDAHPERASEPILEAVAATVIANPSLEQLGVVGARDPSEPATLAAERARTVTDVLVARGVAAARIEPHAIADVNVDIGDVRRRVVWFVILRFEGADASTGEARWLPWRRDCAASWAAWRDKGAMIDCDCLSERPP